jgi:hypothetical protein
MNMVRFKVRKDAGYQKVSGELRRMVQAIKQKKNHRPDLPRVVGSAEPTIVASMNLSQDEKGDYVPS